MIEHMMQWKVYTAFGDTALSSTIYHCLHFQQGLERDENPKPIFPIEIEGKTKYNIELGVIQQLRGPILTQF